MSQLQRDCSLRAEHNMQAGRGAVCRARAAGARGDGGAERGELAAGGRQSGTS